MQNYHKIWGQKLIIAINRTNLATADEFLEISIQIQYIDENWEAFIIEFLQILALIYIKVKSAELINLRNVETTFPYTCTSRNYFLLCGKVFKI